MSSTILKPPALTWFEPDPDAPVIGVKNEIMYRFIWEGWPVSAGQETSLDLIRAGIITLLLLKIPQAAIASDAFIRVVVNESVNFLRAPIGMLPRKGQRITLHDARMVPRVGIDSESVSSLRIKLTVKRDCTVWIGTQRAHGLVK